MLRVVFSNHLTEYQYKLIRVLNLMIPVGVFVGGNVDPFAARVTLKCKPDETTMNILQQGMSENAFVPSLKVFAYEVDENGKPEKCFMFQQVTSYEYEYDHFSSECFVRIVFDRIYCTEEIDNTCKDIEILRYYEKTLIDITKEEFETDPKKNESEETNMTPTKNDTKDEIATLYSSFDTINTTEHDTLIFVDKKLRNHKEDYNSPLNVIGRLIGFYSIGVGIDNCTMDIKVPATIKYYDKISNILNKFDSLEFYVIKHDVLMENVDKCVYVNAKYVSDELEDNSNQILHFEILEMKTDESVEEFCKKFLTEYHKFTVDFYKRFHFFNLEF